MNSLVVYASVMFAFGVIDIVNPKLGNPSLDLGAALILLGIGLAKNRDKEA